MALIECPECGQKISDKAPACIHCGYPLNEAVVTGRKEEKQQIKAPVISQNKAMPISYARPQINADDYNRINANSPNNATAPKDNKLKKYCIVGGIVLVILIVVVACILNSNSDTSSEYAKDDNYEDNAELIGDGGLTPAFEPYSGEVLYGDDTGDSYVQVTTSSSPCVVKLKDMYGNDILAFYVQANDTAKVYVPTEYMYVYFASGETWYGYDNLFGEDTYYSKDDEGIDFSTYTMEYTLYPVTNGNFSQTPIDESEF